MRKFDFEVVTSSALSVDAADGRQARQTVEEALQGVTAWIETGPGTGVELRMLRLLGSARLTLIDGDDPLTRLDEALRAHRDGSGGDKG